MAVFLILDLSCSPSYSGSNMSKASFTEDQIADFQEAFLLYDNRGDGKIAVSLIGDVMRALGQNPTESDVKKLVQEQRADDRVSFETFLPIFQVRARLTSYLPTSYPLTNETI